MTSADLAVKNGIDAVSNIFRCPHEGQMNKKSTASLHKHNESLFGLSPDIYSSTVHSVGFATYNPVLLANLQ